MQYVKDFVNCNNLKIKLDNKTSKPPYFNEGEIWWTSIGVNIGYEEDGKAPNFVRPVLILKNSTKICF